MPPVKPPIPINPYAFKPFDPKVHTGECILPAPVGLLPIRFVYGRYIDIANTKKKDPNTIYFGASLMNKQLTGIFLGDYEMTSKIKDISIYSKKDGVNYINLTFINGNNKLQTIKTTIVSEYSINDLQKQIDAISSGSSKEIKKIEQHLKVLDTSVQKLNNAISSTNVVIGNLIKDVETGKYNYTIKMDRTGIREGFAKSFSLQKGGKKQPNSSVIEIYDFVPKKLVYDSSTISLNLISWPRDVKLEDESRLDNKYKISVSTNLQDLINDVDITLNSSSLINNRLTIIEGNLTWDDLLT